MSNPDSMSTGMGKDFVNKLCQGVGVSSTAGAESKPRFKDELNRTKNDVGKIHKMIAQGTLLFKLVEKRPGMWNLPGMKEFVELAYLITGDTDTYRSSGSITGWGIDTDELSKGFGQKLHDRGMCIHTHGKDVTLQITHVDSERMSLQLYDNNIPFCKWKFSAVDGDGVSINLRVDSTLNSVAGILTPGTVVNMESFVPIWYSYENTEDMRCCIVMRKFKVVGHRPLQDELHGRPLKRAKSIKKENAKAGIPAPTEANPPGVCKCNGELCSKEGVEFVVCITKCIRPESISLPMVARDCVFATREVRDMSPNDKRFLLYYYYATTVYQFHGAGNRVVLPDCLKGAVRELYPKPNFQNLEVEDDYDTNEEDTRAVNVDTA